MVYHNRPTTVANVQSVKASRIKDSVRMEAVLPDVLDAGIFPPDEVGLPGIDELELAPPVVLEDCGGGADIG